MYCKYGIAHNLAETWKAWRDGTLICAYLGDGSKIKAIGPPRNSICEVHSERGIENRQSTEMVMWEDCDEAGRPWPQTVAEEGNSNG